MRGFQLRRALSITEMMVAVSVFAFVGLFVAYLTVEIARQSSSSLSMVPSELTSYRVLDRVRSELLPASTRLGEELEIEGTPVNVEGVFISLEGNAVTFTNRARGTRGRIWFENGAAMFNPDLSASPAEEIVLHTDLEDLVFRFPDRIDRRRVEIEVSTAATLTTVTRTRDRINVYSDVIMLRN